MREDLISTSFGSSSSKRKSKIDSQQRGPPITTTTTTTNWYAIQSEEHGGREYYFNPETNESTWILPDDAHPHPPQHVYNTTDADNDADNEGDNDGNNCGNGDGDDTGPIYYRMEDSGVHGTDSSCTDKGYFSKRRRRFLVVVAIMNLLFLLPGALLLSTILMPTSRKKVLTFFGQGNRSLVGDTEIMDTGSRSQHQSGQQQQQQQQPGIPALSPANVHGRLSEPIQSSIPPSALLPSIDKEQRSTGPKMDDSNPQRESESPPENLHQGLLSDQADSKPPVTKLQAEGDEMARAMTDSIDISPSCLVPFGHLLLKRCRSSRIPPFDVEVFVQGILQ